MSDIDVMAERARRAQESDAERAKALGDYDPEIVRDREMGLMVALPVRGIAEGAMMWPEAAGDLGRKLVHLERMITAERNLIEQLAEELPAKKRAEFIETTLDSRLGLDKG